MSRSVMLTILGIDRASPVLDKVGTRAEVMGGKIDKAGVGAVRSLAHMALGVGALGAAFGVADIVKKTAEFQKSMMLVQTQAGATAAEIKKFTPVILSMAGQVGQAPEALANSLYHVYSTGLRGSKALNAVKIAAEGAAVGNANLEETTNALTAAVASGIKGVQDMQSAMGALNVIVGAGDMSLSQLNEALGSGILVVAKQFGVTLTDVGAALAVFGDNNIRGADAATMLRVSINAMAHPVAGGAKVLAALGLSAKQLSIDMQHGGLNRALQDLSIHLNTAGVTGAGTGAVLLDAFGKKAGPGISILVDQLQRFDQKTQAIKKGAGSFGSEWAATTHTAAFQFKQLEDSAGAAAIQIGQKIVPAMGQMAGTVAMLVPAIVKVGAALAGLWVAAKLADAAFALMGLVGSRALDGIALKGMYAKESLMGMRAAVGPIGMTIAATVGLGAALDSLAHKGDVTGNFFKQTDDLRTQLVNATGPLNDVKDKFLQATLAQDGFATKAAKSGITVSQLSHGIEGNDAAFNNLIATWKATGKPSADTISALELLRLKFLQASDGVKSTADAQTNLKPPVDAATLAIQNENAAAAALNTTMAALSGVLGASQAETSVASAALTTVAALKTTKGSIDETTQAGLTNVQNIQSWIGALQSQYTAISKTKDGQEGANRAYIAGGTALLAQIGKLDGTKSAAYQLAQKLLDLNNIKLQSKALTVTGADAIAAVKLKLLELQRLANIQINITQGNAKRSDMQGAMHAAGGYITGPGTGTSDSIPAMLSNGEFVVNAAAASKHRALLDAINGGTQGFASGGSAGKPKVVPTIDTTLFDRLVKSLTGTAAKIQSAETALYKAIAKIVGGTKSGAAILAALHADNKQMDVYIAERTTLTTKLSTANKNLAAVQSKFRDEITAVSSAITGGFDITQAGVNPFGVTTAGGIVNAANRSVNDAAKFSRELRALKAKGLNAGDIGKIAAAGVSGGGAAADALSKASKAQIRQINSDSTRLDAIGNTTGHGVAGSLYGADMTAAQAVVNELKAENKTLQAEMKRLADAVIHLATAARPITVNEVANGNVTAHAIANKLAARAV